MTRCRLLSGESEPGESAVRYESAVQRESAAWPGVRYSIWRMSYRRRAELLRRVRELGQKTEYLAAGAAATDKIEASLAASAIDAVYLEWGLRDIAGIEIDGEQATQEALLERGPESLVREILAAIKAECGLSAEERKN